MRIVRSDRIPEVVSPRGPSIRLLLGTRHIGITEVMLGPGEVLPAHSTPVNVVFDVRGGSGYVVVENDRAFVGEGTLVESPKNMPHGLEAGDEGFDVLVMKTPNPGWRA